MKRWVAVAALAGLFVVGVLVGALGTHLYYFHNYMKPGEDRFGGRFSERLELTQKQREQVRAIMAESHNEAQAMREELKPRVTELMERSRTRIEEVLTPEQREKFRDFRKQRRGSMERWLLGKGGRHGLPGGPKGRPHRPMGKPGRGDRPPPKTHEAPPDGTPPAP